MKDKLKHMKVYEENYDEYESIQKRLETTNVENIDEKLLKKF